jgi:hypothetical protein
MLVAPSAPSALAEDEPVAVLDEIVQYLVRFRIHSDGANWYGQYGMFAVAARAVAAFTVPPALGLVLGVKPEMQQGVVVPVRDQDDVAAAPAVATAGSALGDVFLPAERETAIAAIAGFDSNYDFVDKHGLDAPNTVIV